MQNLGINLVESKEEKCFDLSHKGGKDGAFEQVN
jgi:hypothetical protein